MAGVNRVILIGNLGADPDVRYTANGDPIAHISLATKETWKDRNTGEKQERTEWHRVVFFGRIADVVKQYLRKGSQVYIEGKLRTRKWQTQEGHDRYTTEVVVDITGTMQMLGGRQESGSSSSVPFDDTPPYPTSTSSNRPQSNAPAAAGNAPPSNYSGGNDFDDDIPF